MYQLRNRYNLEKRKVESMRNDGVPGPKSSWPLFQNLTFLDGHIRPRKSYKSMMKRNMHDDDDGDYMPSSAVAAAMASAMPMLEIKYERHESDDVSELYQCEYETWVPKCWYRSYGAGV